MRSHEPIRIHKRANGRGAGGIRGRKGSAEEKDGKVRQRLRPQQEERAVSRGKPLPFR